jgi:ribosome-associated heat shock protein Hsp15
MAERSPPPSVRVDKWLWAVRVFRTRTAATAACTGGRVTVQGEPAKPATRLTVGDRVGIRRPDRTLVYEVVELVERRGSAAVAAGCFRDESPAAAGRPSAQQAPPGAARARGEGRPTKRDRRQIDRLRGRNDAPG